MMPKLKIHKVGDLWVIFSGERRCASGTDWEIIQKLAFRMAVNRRRVAARDTWLHQPAR